MTIDTLQLRPRLLYDEKFIREQTGLGRDAVLALMHRCGPVRVGRRLLVTPASLAEVFEQLREINNGQEFHLLPPVKEAASAGRHRPSG